MPRKKKPTENESQALVKADHFTAGVKALSEVMLQQVHNPHTRRAYYQALTAYMQWCLDTKTSQFDRPVLIAFQQHLLERGFSPSGINLKIAALKRLALELYANRKIDGHTKESVCGMKALPRDAAPKGASTPLRGFNRAAQKKKHWLSVEELHEVLNFQPKRIYFTAPSFQRRWAMFRAAVALGGLCGLRIASISAIRTNNLKWLVDKDENGEDTTNFHLCLVGVQAKRGKKITLRLPGMAEKAILDFVKVLGKEEEIGFLDEATKDEETRPQPQLFLEQGSLAKLIKRASVKMGISFSSHDLRRTFARTAKNAGATYEQVRDVLGHSSIRTTKIYVEGDDVDTEALQAEPLGSLIEKRLKPRE